MKIFVEQVRSLLRENLNQLKLIYLHYAGMTAKASEDGQTSSNSITLPYVLQMAKDYKILPKICSARALFELYEDMFIRKPGPPGCLENLNFAFNQWVQYLFHISMRFNCSTAGQNRAEDGNEDDSSHFRVSSLLQRMDESLAKNKIKAKGVKAFSIVKEGAPRIGTVDNGKTLEQLEGGEVV